MLRIVLHHAFTHRLIAGTLFFLRQREGFGQLLGHGASVVRVHERRIRQLLRSASKLTQDQRALMLALAGDVFLRDEVHAVDQRRDHADVAVA
jgi:hypothetical protein